MQYEEKVLVELATRFYTMAKNIEVIWTLTGAAIGGMLILGGAAMVDLLGLVAIGAALFGAVLGGAMAWSVARSKTLVLRAQAQGILCMQRIEQNTRRGVQ